MLFNSYVFLLFFLPVTLLLYFGLNRWGKETASQVVLVIMSLYFYAYFHVGYLFVIVGSIIFNYAVSRFMERDTVIRYKKGILVLGVLVNIGVIFYFKYLNFFLKNLNLLFGTHYPLLEILMPLGISFFTFQQISYLVDSYRGETKGYHFLEYALFVSFFPQLIAGPIVLHNEMISQFRDKQNKRLSQEKLAKGLWWLSIGLAKKVLIADTLGEGVDFGYANAVMLGSVDTLLVSVMYTLQIYFDFSGYCDMASGVAAMFGIDLPLNFNSPYKATSIADFWQRWHMSLSRFLQKYVYFPLGGNRKGEARMWLNLMIVFLVSGIWHGAAWTFVIWGALHGVARVFYHVFQKSWNKLSKQFRWFTTFCFVNLTWIFFRAESFSQAGTLLKNFTKSWNLQLHPGLLEQFHYLEFTYLAEHIGVLGSAFERFPGLPMWIVLLVALLLVWIPKNCHEIQFEPKVGNALGSIVLLVWSIMSFSGVSIFLYFNF